MLLSAIFLTLWWPIIQQRYSLPSNVFIISASSKQYGPTVVIKYPQFFFFIKCTVLQVYWNILKVCFPNEKVRITEQRMFSWHSIQSPSRTSAWTHYLVQQMRNVWKQEHEPCEIYSQTRLSTLLRCLKPDSFTASLLQSADSVSVFVHGPAC